MTGSCMHCRRVIDRAGFCSKDCEEAEAALDRKKPFRKTTAQDIELALQRARAAQRSAS